METTRRGFLGLLAGAVLGKIIGPKLIADPTHENWLHAVSLERPTPIESYQPLEILSARILEVVERELKWLRMNQWAVDEWRTVKSGDTVMVRTPLPLWSPHYHLSPLDHLTPVTLLQQVAVDIDLDNYHSCPIHRAWDEYSERRIEPLGLSLAERIIQSVRRAGGANLLVVTGERRFDPTATRILRFDMIYGLGVVKS